MRASPADPAALAAVMEKVIGHQMAKSGLTAAWTSWYAANQGVGLPALLGGTRARVECGISPRHPVFASTNLLEPR